jgi:hypothetical protein
MVQASAPGQTGVEKERFAPGSFITLTQAQALASPTYDLLPSGVVVGAGAPLNGNEKASDDQPKLLRKVRGEGQPFQPREPSGVSAAFPGGLLIMIHDRDRRAAVADRDVRVVAAESIWVTTDDGATHASATQAVRASMLGGGAALAAADAASPIVMQGL